MSWSSRFVPRFFLDAHQGNKVKPKTLEKYSAAAREFAVWIGQCEEAQDPPTPADWDWLLELYKNLHITDA